MSLHLSKYHIVGNHMLQLILFILSLIIMFKLVCLSQALLSKFKPRTVLIYILSDSLPSLLDGLDFCHKLRVSKIDLRLKIDLFIMQYAKYSHKHYCNKL